MCCPNWSCNTGHGAGKLPDTGSASVGTWGCFKREERRGCGHPVYQGDSIWPCPRQSQFCPVCHRRSRGGAVLLTLFSTCVQFSGNKWGELNDQQNSSLKMSFAFCLSENKVPPLAPSHTFVQGEIICLIQDVRILEPTDLG